VNAFTARGGFGEEPEADALNVTGDYISSRDAHRAAIISARPPFDTLRAPRALSRGEGSRY
jgi:hypothetical protein